MAANGLSTTYGGVDGEGWIKITVGTTSGATAATLPEHWKEEGFYEFVVLMGGAYAENFVYNPGGTSSAGSALLPAPGTAGTAVGVINPVKSDGTLSTTHVINLVKDATTGVYSIRQNTSANRNAATVWARRTG